MKPPGDATLLVQGAIIAALLGIIAGRAIGPPEMRPQERQAGPTQYQRTVAAIARAHAFSGP